MSDKEILQFIMDGIRDIKEELGKHREHVSNQISNCHSRIDDMVEKHHGLKEYTKQRDVDIERRINIVGTAAAAIVVIVIEVIKIIIPAIGKVFK
jgi:hypothetical protein